MILPKDPYMLLSVINMKLRDSSESFEDICADADASASGISETLEKIGYVYSEKLNRFVPDEKQGA